MIVDPIIHNKQPSFPSKFSLSFRNFEDKIAATMTDKAPSGVTKDAGANIYAVKLSTSPSPTEKERLIRYQTISH